VAVGVVRDGVLLAERAEREQRSHTASLPRLLERVLASAGLTIAEVDGIAVSIGPGSFTGLRVGLALAKGIALAGGATLVGVSTLEALAQVADAPTGATIYAALDARKREVYAACFAATSEGPRRLTADVACAPGVLAERLAPDSVMVGDAAEVYTDVFAGRCMVRPFATHHPRGGVVAQLGWERLLRGEAANAGALVPVYVRPPEAELSRANAR
jgi:tRNA threonylcarbamoyladenosine biosynthesis protein TsaB